jgi:serine protease AprX
MECSRCSPARIWEETPRIEPLSHNIYTCHYVYIGTTLKKPILTVPTFKDKKNGLVLALLANFLFFIASHSTSFGQNNPRYFILFKDKTGTPFSTDQPNAYLSERAIARRIKQQIPIVEADLPVNPTYVQAVKATGAYVFHTSKWLNGIVVSASTSQIQAIEQLPFFDRIEKGIALTGPNYSARIGHKNKFEAVESLDYGSSLNQLDMLGVPTLHEMGFTGAGMLIGIFDSGFTNADQQGYFTHLYTDNRVVDTYDFIDNEENVYNDHSHGLNVMSVMASKWEGNLIGPAFDASYVLYRTEKASSETPYEEVAWLLAAERADSLGVDIVNTSLGYYDFDNSIFDYTYTQMDGRTTIISRAARQAARTGMLMVVSAGNEGSSAWKYITAPADVDSVLTVGAVTSAGIRSSFSSFGPNAEGHIKPDVVALGTGVRIGQTNGMVGTSQGTSFSSPLIASFAALLWQVYPDHSAQELIELIRSLGNQSNTPDSERGYGIPYFEHALNINRPDQLSAQLAANVVNLNWEYLQQDVASHYEVERAWNDSNFEPLGSVTGVLQLSDTLRSNGTYRYRVRAVVGLRNSSFSEIATVVFTVTGKETLLSPVSLWPNPAVGDYFHLDLSRYGTSARIDICNAAGQTLFKIKVPASDVIEVPVNMLSPGVYFVKISNDEDATIVKKFVKN